MLMETTGRGNISNHRKLNKLTAEQSRKRESHINRERARARLKLLYANEPDSQLISTSLSAINITVGLVYGDVDLKVACPFGVPLESLPYILHKEMMYHEMQKNNKDPLQAVAKVIGFESARRHVTFDYKLSIGKGQLTKNIDLKCFYYGNDRDLRKYKIYRCLAIGGFSKVYLVRSKRDGRFFAMKVMQKEFIFTNEKEGVVFNEKKICSSIEHPFIVKLYHSFETKNFTFFVFQYCPGGELFYLLKKVKRMSQSEARFYFVEIMYGLQYLHEKGIVYRDLKPQNLLITADGHLKIADFGLSKEGMQQDVLTYSYCGSAEYMPPQMILRTGHSFGVDFYTLGALLYELVTGLPPFYSRNEQEIRDFILYEPLSFPRDLPLSEEIKSLLNGLLNKNQKMRLGCLKGIKQILFHPWLGKLDSKAILTKIKSPPFCPDLEELNFDDNELGDDEKQFTEKVRRQAKLKQSNKHMHFEGINYESEENTLSSEHQKVIEALSNNKETSYSGTQGCMDKIIQHSPYLSRLFKHREFMAGNMSKKGNNTSSCDRQNYHHTHSITDLRRIYGGEHSNSRRIRGPLKESSAINLRHKLIPIGKSQSPIKKLKLKLNRMLDD